MRTERLYRAAATGFCFGVFGLGGLGVLLAVFPLLALVPGRERRNRLARSFIHHSFRGFTRLMIGTGVMSLEVRGIERLRRRGLLILANHPSLIDVVLLMAAVPSPDCVVKAALWKNPFTCGPVRVAGFIRNDDGAALVDACVGSQSKGNNLIIFPEGTRTRPGQPLAFQRGAANVAVRGARRITPVVIRTSEPTLCKGEPWYRVPLRRPHFLLEVQEDIAVPDLVAANDAPAREVRALTSALHEYFTEKITRHANTG
jgi:1-acyl-sn-glycerol-3-phosphate acyltransferase